MEMSQKEKEVEIKFDFNSEFNFVIPAKQLKYLTTILQQQVYTPQISEDITQVSEQQSNNNEYMTNIKEYVSFAVQQLLSNKNVQLNEYTKDLFTMPKEMAEEKLSKASNQANLSYAGLQTKYQSLTTGQQGIDGLVKGTNIAMTKIAGLFNKQVEEIQQNKKYVESQQQEYDIVHGTRFMLDQLIQYQKQLVNDSKGQMKKIESVQRELGRIYQTFSGVKQQDQVYNKLQQDQLSIVKTLTEQQKKLWYLQFLQQLFIGCEVSYMRLFIAGHELFNARDSKISKLNAARKEAEEIFAYTKIQAEDLYSQKFTALMN